MGNVRALGGHDERSGGFLYRPSTGARDVNELIDPALGYTMPIRRRLTTVSESWDSAARNCRAARYYRIL